MTICSTRKAFVALIVSALFITAPVRGGDRTEHPAAAGDRPHRRLHHARKDRAAQLQAQRQKIAQLKQRIAEDHQRVRALRQELQQLNARIGDRGARQGGDQSAHTDRRSASKASKKARSQMAALKRQLAAAVDAGDTQQIAAVRHRIQQLKARAHRHLPVRQKTAQERQEIIRRFEAKIEAARSSQQHDYADALSKHLRRLKAASRRNADHTPAGDRQRTVRRVHDRVDGGAR